MRSGEIVFFSRVPPTRTSLAISLGQLPKKKKIKMKRCHWDTSLSGWHRSHTRIALAFGTTFWVMALNLLVLGTILLWKRN
jgi:hypothetical protein